MCVQIGRWWSQRGFLTYPNTLWHMLFHFCDLDSIVSHQHKVPDIVLWPEWLYSLQTTSDLLFGAAGIVVYTSGVTYAVGILNNSPFARLSDLWGHRSPEVNCTCYQWHNELQVPYKPQLTTNLALNVSSPCTGSATSTSESVSPLGMLKHEMHTVGRVSILQWYWVDPLKKQFQVKSFRFRF